MLQRLINFLNSLTALGFLIVGLLTFAKNSQAAFFDRPDYFENKAIYDEMEAIIDILFDPKLTDLERHRRLSLRDKNLAPSFETIKIENEKQFIEQLRKRGLSSDEIDGVLREPKVIDGFKFTMENDVIAKTDHYYTNGLKVEISFNNKKFEEFFKKMGFSHSDFFITCGQSIYTDSEGSPSSPIPGEPANAGVLYCGGAVNSYKMDQEKARIKSLDRFEIQMGAIGKYSFAEEVQNSFHALINNKAQNWTSQVGDRFYFNIEFDKYKKIAEGDLYGDGKPEYNVIINAGGNAGTLTNYMNAGVIFNYRLLGTLIDMYVGNTLTPTLAEELAMMNLENRLKRLLCHSDWSLNVSMGAQARYVLNNYRIDGYVNTQSDIVPLVFDLKAGVVLRYKRAFLEFSVNKRSSEWQSGITDIYGDEHIYGSLSIKVAYDSFSDLSQLITDPFMWATNAEFRKKMMEKNRIRALLQREGVKVLYDDNNPKTPLKSMLITCQK